MLTAAAGGCVVVGRKQGYVKSGWHSQGGQVEGACQGASQRQAEAGRSRQAGGNTRARVQWTTKAEAAAGYCMTSPTLDTDLSTPTHPTPSHPIPPYPPTHPLHTQHMPDPPTQTTPNTCLTWHRVLVAAVIGASPPGLVLLNCSSTPAAPKVSRHTQLPAAGRTQKLGALHTH